MALKAVVSAVEDVPEAQRSLYKQVDGKWVLDLDGGTPEDIAKLQGALNKERESRGALEKELAKVRKDIEGLDPEKAREALKKLQDLEEKKLIDEGKVDELVASRTKALIADHQNQVKRFQDELASSKQAVDKLTGQIRELTLHGGLRDLATKPEFGVRQTGVTDLIQRMTAVGVGPDRVRWDVRDGKVVALKGDELVYGKDPTKVMSLEEGLELVRGEAPHLFEPSTGGGANNGGGPNLTLNGSVLRIGRDQARDPQAYRAARAQAEKQGATLVINE